MLTCTGAGDAHEQSPRWRRVPFERLPAGDTYLKSGQVERALRGTGEWAVK